MIRTTIKDQSENVDGELNVVIEDEPQGITIYIEGYGDNGSAEGHGSPIFLELYRGELRLHVWDDINEGDPKTINLEGAREDKRDTVEDCL